MSLRDIQAGAPGFVPFLARAGLRVLSWGWAAGAWVRGAMFRLGLRKARGLDVPVLCVGNITAGGTGKTPFVIWLARRLVDAGRTPGIVARGYGQKSAAHPDLNDEGAVIHGALAGLPQVQGPDRHAAGLRLLERHPGVDVLILDDGFQHRQLRRDLDIVLLDATCPFGHGYLLPRGLLRERPGALSRAGAVVITRAERLDPDALGALRAQVGGLTQAPIAVARTEPREPDALRGQKVLVCCGIGNPEAFLGTLADLGAEVVSKRILGDHERLSESGWRQLAAEAQAAGACVVTTRKDAVKVAKLPDGVVIVDVDTEVVEGADALWEAVEGVM